MIVKCQMPLGGLQQILIYDENRTIRLFQPITEEWLNFFQGEAKFYAEAHIENTTLVIDQVVEEQPW